VILPDACERGGELGCERCSEAPEDSVDGSVVGDDGHHALMDGASDAAAAAATQLVRSSSSARVPVGMRFPLPWSSM
jgi:hypothetical protein